jgi:hypothetical protein
MRSRLQAPTASRSHLVGQDSAPRLAGTDGGWMRRMHGWEYIGSVSCRQRHGSGFESRALGNQGPASRDASPAKHLSPLMAGELAGAEFHTPRISWRSRPSMPDGPRRMPMGLHVKRVQVAGSSPAGSASPAIGTVAQLDRAGKWSLHFRRRGSTGIVSSECGQDPAAQRNQSAALRTRRSEVRILPGSISGDRRRADPGRMLMGLHHHNVAGSTPAAGRWQRCPA